MSDRQAIERRLVELKEELSTVNGTPTEVYSRIVGYYRSIANWNAGKRNEYDARREYNMPIQTAAEGKASKSERRFSILTTKTVIGVPFPPLLTFSRLPESKTAAASPAMEPIEHQVGNGTFIVFTRKACPNCPPVMSFLKESGFPVVFVDVDSTEGLELARQKEVLSTPTVIALDGEENESFRACGLGELKRKIEKAIGIPARHVEHGIER